MGSWGAVWRRAHARAWAGFNASFARYSAVEDRVRAEWQVGCDYECIDLGIDRLVADAETRGLF